MAIQNAVNFISAAEVDDQLRREVNGASSEDLGDVLAKCGYDFSEAEFEEAVNLLHVQCKYESQANALMQIAHWYRLLNV